MELREKQEETGLRGANPSVRDLAAGGALLWKTAKGAGYAAKGGAHIAAFAARKGKSLAQTASLARESRAALATLTREQKKQWDSYTPRQQRQILEKVSRKIERRMAYTASDAKAGTGTGRNFRTVRQAYREQGWSQDRTPRRDYRQQERRIPFPAKTQASPKPWVLSGSPDFLLQRGPALKGRRQAVSLPRQRLFNAEKVSASKPRQKIHTVQRARGPAAGYGVSPKTSVHTPFTVRRGPGIREPMPVTGIIFRQQRLHIRAPAERRASRGQRTVSANGIRKAKNFTETRRGRLENSRIHTLAGRKSRTLLGDRGSPLPSTRYFKQLTGKRYHAQRGIQVKGYEWRTGIRGATNGTLTVTGIRERKRWASNGKESLPGSRPAVLPGPAAKTRGRRKQQEARRNTGAERLGKGIRAAKEAKRDSRMRGKRPRQPGVLPDVRRATGRQRPGTRGSPHSGKAVYWNPRVTARTLRAIRQKRAKEGFSGRRKPAPKARTDLFGRQSVSGNGRSLRGLVKRQYRPREDKPYDRGYFLRRELTLLAEGKDGHRRQVHTAGRRGKPGRTETFYSADPVKARKKEARIRRKQKREIKKAGKKRGKLFRSELARTLAQDMRRANGIRQMQRMEQISMQEMERENTRAVLRTVTFPARFSLRLALRKAVPGIASALAAGIKSALPILVPVGGVLFLLLFLVLFIQGLFAGIAGEEAADGQTAAGSAAGAEVVEYAEQWIGVVRYVWGGGREHDTAWQTYADCSSFVHGVFAHFGYEIGGSTYEQENTGTPVEGGLDGAVPGDIILFYSGSIAPGNSSHVGIYAGDGQMIHCSGGRANTYANPGRGVIMSQVAADGRPYLVRRIIQDTGNITTGSYDVTEYTQEQLELIWAVVRQEAGTGYESNLAVISTAMNRVDSPAWAYCGRNAYEQLTAPGQFCYSIDNYWRQYLGGNVPETTKQAVRDCLEDGKRNHSYTSFRSGYVEGSVQIGENGNYYF